MSAPSGEQARPAEVCRGFDSRTTFPLASSIVRRTRSDPMSVANRSERSKAIRLSALKGRVLSNVSRRFWTSQMRIRMRPPGDGTRFSASQRPDGLIRLHTVIKGGSEGIGIEQAVRRRIVAESDHGGPRSVIGEGVEFQFVVAVHIEPIAGEAPAPVEHAGVRKGHRRDHLVAHFGSLCIREFRGRDGLQDEAERTDRVVSLPSETGGAAGAGFADRGPIQLLATRLLRFHRAKFGGLN